MPRPPCRWANMVALGSLSTRAVERTEDIVGHEDLRQNCLGLRGGTFSETCRASKLSGPNCFGRVVLRIAASQSGWWKDSLPFLFFHPLQRPDQHSRNRFRRCHIVVKILSVLQVPFATSTSVTTRPAFPEEISPHSHARANGFSARCTPMPSTGTRAPVGTIMGTRRRYSA